MLPEYRALWETFRNKEAAKLATIENYVHFARSNYVRLHRDALDGLSVHGELDWAAVNTGIRIKATSLMLDAFDGFSRRTRKAKPRVFSVFVGSDRWLTGVANRHTVDISTIQAELRELFRGLHYVGMIEPGLYPRSTLGSGSSVGVVSWHAHLVFWDVDDEALVTALAKWNRANTGPLFGVPPANYRRRSWKSAPERLTYLMKSPAKSYTTRPMPESVDVKTGEIVPEHDRQYSQKLRPGQHVHLLNALRDFTLDDLLVVGGTGWQLVAPLLGQIERDRKRAQHLRPWGVRHPVATEERHSLCYADISGKCPSTSGRKGRYETAFPLQPRLRL